MDFPKKELSTIAMDGSILSERKLSEFFMGADNFSPKPPLRKDSFFSDIFAFGKEGISNMRSID